MGRRRRYRKAAIDHCTPGRYGPRVFPNKLWEWFGITSERIRLSVLSNANATAIIVFKLRPWAAVASNVYLDAIYSYINFNRSWPIRGVPFDSPSLEFFDPYSDVGRAILSEIEHRHAFETGVLAVWTFGKTRLTFDFGVEINIQRRNRYSTLHVDGARREYSQNTHGREFSERPGFFFASISFIQWYIILYGRRTEENRSRALCTQRMRAPARWT